MAHALVGHRFDQLGDHGHVGGLVFSQSAAPAGASYNRSTQRFTLPGSGWPLAVFMAIFACKFVVGMLSAVAPEHIRSLPAAIGISALYGLLSGIVIARVWRFLKLQ